MTNGDRDLDHQRRRQDLVAELVDMGAVRSPAWHRAFAQVPRHRFVPRFYQPVAGTSDYRPVDSTDPAQQERWAAGVYRDDALVTQLDGDDSRWETAVSHGPVGGRSTSSSSQPSLMAVMLEALEVADTDRVLEVGTGTGYNAALLCHRLGSDQVTTIDLDAHLADNARARLADCGYTPTVVAGDGARGHPDGAPYDRLIATCSVDRVPPAWIGQVRPGGRILTALYRGLGGFGLARLTVHNDGGASGRFLAQTGGFMPLRATTLPDTMRLFQAARDQDGPARPAVLPRGALRSRDAQLWLALRLPAQTAQLGVRNDDGGWQRYLLGVDGSWARVTDTGDGHRVQEGGPVALWTMLERRYQEWQHLGCPARERLGLTVDAHGRHELWLDAADSSHHWELRFDTDSHQE